ncbi:cyclin-T1-3 [Argentina anserina]|uniref:cyclin-T1-3 n=1 Tax=Argentina anserina TaxID=57926 RepID=UPI0021769525|nr:cyclin-T1-3 [Potentilla anserina]XP_050364275.1 cyclin-T1-3 [Potentilla anserina]
MGRPVPENPCGQGIAKASTSMCITHEAQCPVRKWYFTKQEIEDSPSRRDGISTKKESHLRSLYCSFLQEIGMKLKVPQLTISSAMMLCHQFYMRQSHAKNGWQTVATASIFLACKAEDTPRYLNDVVVVAYEMVHKFDSAALHRIRQKGFLNKQKELILVAERLLLSTIGYDLDIQLPYKILVAALKKLDLLPDLAKAAWSFVNDWLRTSLCLQYKPHYIAAGSVALAANFQKVKLPKEKGKVWWLEFDVTPKQLDEVIQRMHSMFKPLPAKTGMAVQPEIVSKKSIDSSPQSCISSEAMVDQHPRQGAAVDDRGLGGESVMSSSRQNLGGEDSATAGKDALPCQTNDSSIVKNTGDEIKPIKGELDDQSSCKILEVPKSCGKIDINRIRELKRKRCDKGVNKKLAGSIHDELDPEAWIESELENGVELQDASTEKKQRKA